MDKLPRKDRIIFTAVILILVVSCQGSITPVPAAPEMTQTNTPTPVISTPTLEPVQKIWETILTQSAWTPAELPVLQVDNSVPVPVEKRLGKGIAYSFAVSPDGKSIAVTGNLSVSVYEVETLEEIWTSPLEQTGEPIPPKGSAAWSPDGKQLATLSGIGVTIWDAETGEQLQVIEKHSYDYYSIAWFSDGRLLASGFSLNMHDVQLWDVQTGEEVFIFSGASQYTWMPDNNLLALNMGFKEIIIWDIASNRQVYFPMKVCDTYCVIGMNFSLDGTRLAVAADGIPDRVLIWDVQTGKQLMEFEVPKGEDVLTMAWSPDNNYLAVSIYHGAIIIWDVQTGEQIQFLGEQAQLFKAVGENTIALEWASDGKRLISLEGHPFASTYNQRLVVWDVETGEQLRSLNEGRGPVFGVAWSPSGELLASTIGKGEVAIWQSSNGRKLRSLYVPDDEIYNLAWSPDGKFLALGGHDLTIWDTQNERRILYDQPDYSYQGIAEVAWSPDGKKLASLYPDGQGSIWDATTGEKLLTLPKNRFSEQIDWSPQGYLVGTSYPFETNGMMQVTLWDSFTGEAVLTKQGFTDIVWSPDGDIIASVSDNGTKYLHDDVTMVLWDAKSGNEIRRITPGVFLNYMDWSPDAKYLVIAQDEERALIVIDVQTGERIYRLKGHADFVTDVAWSPRGDLIASASGDGTVIIWKVDNH